MAEILAGIDVFVAAVETNSFSAAAERLRLTRSAVAKAVAKLESRLGVRLFHRTTRSQTLTEDGQIFYERCVRALEELRSGQAALESGKRDAVGRLRVSAPVLLGRQCVAPVLARLAGRHPRLELELSMSDRPVDLIEDGFDLAVRNGDIQGGAGLMTRSISVQTMTVYAAPSYLAAHGRPESLSDLSRHQGILYSRPGYAGGWRFRDDGGGLREATPPARLRFDDLAAIADAAEAGYGLAWLPGWLARDRVRSGRLVPLLTTVPGLSIKTHVLWLQTPHLSLRVRLAIDALAEELPRLMSSCDP